MSRNETDLNKSLSYLDESNEIVTFSFESVRKKNVQEGTDTDSETEQSRKAKNKK